MKTRFTLFFFVFTICTGAAITVRAQVDVQDSLALVDLYNSTNGSGWSHHKNWLTGPVSTWYGITLTNDSKRVGKIELYYNKLEGSLPHSIGNFSALAVLDLRNNNLNNSIPPELGNLINLTNLVLPGNRLSGNIPPELGNLTNLWDLELGYNQLSGGIPPKLGNLANLGSLKLSNNLLSGSIPPELGNLSNLEILYLNNNRLSGTIPSSLTNLNFLFSLDLSYNRFSFNGMELIAQKFYFAKYNTQAILTPHIKGNAISVSAGGTLSNNTYIWYKKGQAGKTRITGDSVFHPTESGVYVVRVQNSIAKHLNLFSDTITYVAPVALNAIAASIEQKNTGNSFSVYPNPVKDILNIHAGGSASFSLLDESGKVLLSKDIAISGSINVSGIAAGFYYLKNSNTGDITKIVIAR